MNIQPSTFNFQLLPVLICIILAGCERDSTPPQGPDEKLNIASTPLETVRTVHQYRREGRLSAVSKYLLPDQRDAVLDYILAVDELSAAVHSLESAVRDRIGTGTAELFDHSEVANMLGPFSLDVRFVDQTVDGDRAVVTMSVAQRLPLEELELRRQSDKWIIVTDPPVPGLADEIRNLAVAVERVTVQVRRGELDQARIQKELALRQRPVLERIDKLISDPQD